MTFKYFQDENIDFTAAEGAGAAARVTPPAHTRAAARSPAWRAQTSAQAAAPREVPV
jgi:hypothetical protein